MVFISLRVMFRAADSVCTSSLSLVIVVEIAEKKWISTGGETSSNRIALIKSNLLTQTHRHTRARAYTATKTATKTAIA